MATITTIQVPVADLRRNPAPVKCTFEHDPARETQLLFNEKIEIVERQSEWVRVKALEQACFKEENWHPYEGWVHEREISTVEAQGNPTHVIAALHFASYSYGTYLFENEKNEIVLPDGKTLIPEAQDAIRPLSAPFSRDQLIIDARKFIGSLYLWGGRAAYSTEQVSSVDCSGLINLIYRGQGRILPRDAKDQFRVSKEIEKKAMQPGDVVFLGSKEDRNKIVHVILYCGDNTFIESPQTGHKVRFLLDKIHIWEDQGLVHYQDRDTPYWPFYRTFLG